MLDSPEPIASLLGPAFGAPGAACDVIPLRGGLESAVARVRFLHPTPEGRSVSRSAIVKRLEGFHRREADLYRVLRGTGFAPELLAAVDRDEATYLFLEPVRPVVRWPWKNTDDSRLVMRQLASIHSTDIPVEAAAWSYESALSVAAAETADTIRAAAFGELPLRRWYSVVERVAAALPTARAQMMDELGMSFIHGDAHPGNVMLRERGGRRTVVFLDWARSRFGSPLEDVASWLQTLRHWEPVAAQRHDTLFREYLQARGDRRLDSAVREAYWVACASNVMAGSLRYHLLRAGETRGRERERQLAQAQHALRVIRRADAVIRR